MKTSLSPNFPTSPLPSEENKHYCEQSSLQRLEFLEVRRAQKLIHHIFFPIAIDNLQSHFAKCNMQNVIREMQFGKMQVKINLPS